MSIDERLKLHQKWILNEPGGIRLEEHGSNLQGANLQETDLQKANLWGANLQGTNLQGAKLQGAKLWEANLQGAKLQGANLQGTNLQGANLQGADIDYSCIPIWCGGLNFKVDKRIWIQLAYHLCSLNVEDEECLKYRKKLLPITKKFHRITECGELKDD